MAEQNPLTIADIEAGFMNPEWCGGGYLGERQRTTAGAGMVALSDQIVLNIVNRAGWTPEEFFGWLNSKLGRHYGDLAFGNDLSEREIYSKATEWRLIVKVED